MQKTALAIQMQKTALKNLFLIKSYVISKQSMYFWPFSNFSSKFSTFLLMSAKIGSVFESFDYISEQRTLWGISIQNFRFLALLVQKLWRGALCAPPRGIDQKTKPGEGRVKQLFSSCFEELSVPFYLVYFTLFCSYLL